MAMTTLFRAITIQAPLTAVFNFWKVPANHAKIHPFIVNIEEIESGVDENNQPYIVFAVTDRIKFWGIPYTVKYTTLMVQNGPAQLTFTTSQSPGIRIKSVVTFASEGEETLVEENYSLEAPGWLMGYVKRQVEKSHGRMMEKAKTLLEREA